jgi:hypothetical protein
MGGKDRKYPMNMKEHILTALMEQFNRWEEFIAAMSEAQILAPLQPSPWSTKDVMAHLMAWQKRSIARLNAAQAGREPEFPQWAPELTPDSVGDTDLTNDWIYKTYRQDLWPKIYAEWKEGFLHFLELAEGISERDLMDESRFTWMEERPLALVLIASYDHHQEHYDKVKAWMSEHEFKGGDR